MSRAKARAAGRTPGEATPATPATAPPGLWVTFAVAALPLTAGMTDDGRRNINPAGAAAIADAMCAEFLKRQVKP